MNTVTMVGTAIVDPSFSTGHASGRPKLRATVTVLPTHSGRDRRSGIAFSPVSWVTVVLAEVLAESVVAQVRRGDRVIAVGRLRSRSWRKADGMLRTEVVLLADEVGVALSTADAWEPDADKPVAQ